MAENDISAHEPLSKTDVSEPHVFNEEAVIDFTCKVCGVQCAVAPNPPDRAICPEHCADHDYEYVAGECIWACKHCFEERPYDS
jgi:hypothetical protein